MISIKPAQQIQLFGLKNFFLKLQILYINNRLPKKKKILILLKLGN